VVGYIALLITLNGLRLFHAEVCELIVPSAFGCIVQLLVSDCDVRVVKWCAGEINAMVKGSKFGKLPTGKGLPFKIPSPRLILDPSGRFGYRFARFLVETQD
jgi:hypothetical protein